MTRMFNNITTNRNNTAIAPTYTIKIKKAKNSTPKIKAKQELRKNIKTKAKIECTGLLVNNTNKPTKKNNDQTIKKNSIR